MLVMFEDQKGNPTENDWDFNDVGMRLDATLELSEDGEGRDVVSKVIVLAEGVFGEAGYTHSLSLAFTDFVGTGTYTIERWDSDQDPSIDEPYATSNSLIYDPQSDDPNIANILVFRNSKRLFVDDAAISGINGDWRRITLTVDDPSSNPRTGFDRVPFDSWLYVWTAADKSAEAANGVDMTGVSPGTGQSTHIYDPYAQTPEYFDDYNEVLKTGPMYGLPLNGGLIIPKLDWQLPPDPREPHYYRLWDYYPDFVGFATSNRTEYIKNRNWYENYSPPSP